MEDLSPSDLKTILHSKRANLYLLEHCRVLVNGGRVEYVTEAGKSSLYWNIPIANTTAIMFGTGTSVTQAAMREFAKAGVLVGFCGGGGSPLFSATEVQVEVEWLTPQSEYRPTEYLQHWVSFWFKEEQRLAAAKIFQQVRLDFLKERWSSDSIKREDNFNIDSGLLSALLDESKKTLNFCKSVGDLLVHEAALSKKLYAIAAKVTQYGDFSRAKAGSGSDLANRYLDHGNYLAYGQAATAAWVLGLPHGLAVMHGKTRRGGLVFDIADLVKDAIVLPQAFISAMAGEEEGEFRTRCIEKFNRFESLDLMIDTVKSVALQLSEAKK